MNPTPNVILPEEEQNTDIDATHDKQHNTEDPLPGNLSEAAPLSTASSSCACQPTQTRRAVFAFKNELDEVLGIHHMRSHACVVRSHFVFRYLGI